VQFLLLLQVIDYLLVCFNRTLVIFVECAGVVSLLIVLKKLNSLVLSKIFDFESWTFISDTVSTSFDTVYSIWWVYYVGL